MVRLGVSLSSRHSHPDPRLGTEAMVRRAAVAHAAGLDSLFLGDHHAVADGYFQNVPMLGRLLAGWTRTAGALFLIPLWQPLLLAEQVATLAALAEGRFVLQCALGGGEDQFRAMGVPLPERVERFESGLAAIRRLLAGEEVTASGSPGFGPAQISPIPPQPVDVWIGASAPPAIDRAARMGDGWIAAPGITLHEAKGQLALYRELCERHGTPEAAAVIRRDVFVGRDRREAEAVVDPEVAAGYRGFDPEVLVYGDVGEVTDSLARLAELGFTDILIRHIGGDEDQIAASLERLGQVRSALST